MKDNYQNNVIVGRIPESSSTFSEVANMRIWLRRSTVSKVPIMIFLKRPNIPTIVKGKPRFINIVPEKVTPNYSPKLKEESIWDAIARYEQEPFESRVRREDETLTSEEMALVSGTLSNEQKSYMMEMLKYQKEEAEEISSAVSESKEVVSNGNPENGIKLIALAQATYKSALPELKSILGDDFLKNYKPEMWEKVVKHYGSIQSK
jgi:hypothetical protein